MNKIEEQIRKTEQELKQESRRLARLKNRKTYYESGERQKRAHRLIARGAAIESIAPEIKTLGEVSDYTHKRGIVHTEILLPSHAPPEYSDRQTLWNAVEKAEPHPKTQLAYSFDIALKNEFSIEENIALARQFL